MTRRAEHVVDTRRRIIEAAVRLHTTIGPARSSIAAIAEEAGVTRLTLYRHFPDQEALFAACIGHWTAQNPPPDTTSWRAVPDFQHRTRVALTELYGWFGERGDELYPNYRDVDSMPPPARRRQRDNRERQARALLGEAPPDGNAGRLLRAAASHVVSFWTWRSLVVEAGLSLEDAVELGVRLMLAAQAGSPEATKTIPR
jgi:AcrR family transcriptional regulator